MEVSGQNSGSDSDVDSFTEDLDLIGRFNIPRISDYISTENLPSFPSFGAFATLPNFGSLPSAANLPTFDLAEVRKFIAHHVNSVTSGPVGEGPLASFESRANFKNSVKTAVAMRMQMSAFLSDLKGGQSLQAALDRLQPITELIHEAITLPADDDDDEDEECDEKNNPDTGKRENGEKNESGVNLVDHDTEPVGVGRIVNREQPFVSELVLPDADTIGGVLGPTPTRRHHRHIHGTGNKRAASILSDEYGSNTDLDTVDELTREEAEALTHLDLLDDFFKEDLLRRKIQRIQTFGSLSQHLKNKLVTKLMMGNYYKYINQKLRKEHDVGDGLELLSNAGESGANTAKRGHSSLDSSRNGFTSISGPEPLVIVEENEDDLPDMSMDDEDEDDMEEDEVVLTETDTIPTYHNKTSHILGCQHYQRNCKLECPTCFRWFTCRFCHDAEVTDHKLSRSDVKHILCMKCNTPQVPDTNYCVNCEEELANYFCLKCVLYDNDPSKDIYHCDKCGICRLGLGLSKDYFHCDTCNICLSIDLKEHHRCVSNTTHCNCPICNEYLFTSVNKVVFMKCGHLIHQSCYDEMIKHSYKCPICKKTVVNTETQFRILDQEIRQLPLPAPYDKWRCIISCNDCKGKSNCAYHVMGLKCRYCASYNTNQLKLIKPEEAEDDEEMKPDTYTDAADDEHRARLTSMRLIKTNLSSNFLIDEQTTDSNVEGTAKEDYDMALNYGDSAYEGDNNDEDDDMTTMVNMKRFTRAVLGERNVDRTSLLEMFQNFINATFMDDDEVAQNE